MPDYQFIIISVDQNRLNKTTNILNEINKNNKHIIPLNGFTPENSEEYFEGCSEYYKFNHEYNKRVMCVVRSHMKAIEIASLDTSTDFSIILEDDVTFHKELFIDIIEELITNWDDITITTSDHYKTHIEFMHIGWTPIGNYKVIEEENQERIFHYKLKSTNNHTLIKLCTVGAEAYIIRKKTSQNIRHIYTSSTYNNWLNNVTQLMKNKIDTKEFNKIFDNSNAIPVDHVLFLLFYKPCAIFPPIAIERFFEQSTISKKYHNDSLGQLWLPFFKDYETKIRDYIGNEHFPIHLMNMDKPLVISYENDKPNSNSLLFQKTLERNNWDSLFIGEGEKWNGFTNKINGYYNILQKLPEDKIVLLSDSRDVFCLRSPKHFLQHLNEILDLKEQILVSAEMFLVGHMDWTKEIISNYLQRTNLTYDNFFSNGIPLNKYWSYHDKQEHLPLRKYVNSGLIVGKVSNLLKIWKWILDNDISDDQLGVAKYTETFPQFIKLDYEATILHTSCYGVNAGLYDMEKQKYDSPTFSELFGMSSYFLHIPGIHSSKGQKHIYNIIREMIENEKNITTSLYSLYNIQEDDDLYHQYIIKNND